MPKYPDRPSRKNAYIQTVTVEKCLYPDRHGRKMLISRPSQSKNAYIQTVTVEKC